MDHCLSVFLNITNIIKILMKSVGFFTTDLLVNFELTFCAKRKSNIF